MATDYIGTLSDRGSKTFHFVRFEGFLLFLYSRKIFIFITKHFSPNILIKKNKFHFFLINFRLEKFKLTNSEIYSLFNLKLPMKFLQLFKIMVVITFLGLNQFCLAQSVTLDPNSATAIVDAKSTTKGALQLRMTLLQRNIIPLSEGLQVYCTTCSPSGPYS